MEHFFQPPLVKDSVKILLVEDNPADACLIREILAESTDLSFDLEWVDRLAGALPRVAKGGIDIILLDLALPDNVGLDTFVRTHAQANGIPIIVLTGFDDALLAVKAVRAGAQDYLVKGQGSYAQLSRSIRYAMERAHALSSITALQQFHQGTINALASEIAILDEQGVIISVNSAWADFAQSNGLDAKRAGVGANYLDVCDLASFQGESIAAEAARGIREVLHKRRESLCVEYPCHSAQAERWFGMRVTRFEEHGKARVVVSHDNITERKLAEENVRRAREETEEILSSITAILIGVDENDTIFRWNAVAEKTFGIPAASLLGGPFAESGIKWEWVAILRSILECMGGSATKALREIPYTTPDGKPGFLALNVSPIVKTDGRPGGYLLFGSETTQQRNLQEQLSQAQKLESIGRLAAGIAHEINTPTQFVGDNVRFCQETFGDLISVAGAMRDLIAQAENGPISPETLQTAQAAAGRTDLDYLKSEIPQAMAQSLDGLERIAKIVSAMKEFAHPGEVEMTSVDINHLIDTTITLGRNEWKYVAEMVTDLDPGLPPVVCLPGEISQAILNIIVNAAHAIGDVVDRGETERGRITVSTARSGENVVIRIGDTGGGIPANVRSKIFDPFFTTKQAGKGTGQGLAIAREAIAKRHKGKLEFETEVGKGTTFIIELPIRSAAAARSAS